MREARLSTTFCTDNRTVSNTTVTDEIALGVKHLDMGAQDLRRNIIYGFKRSFFPGSYLEKRSYVRRIIDYYETIQSQYPALQTVPSES
jgi:adenosine deaminase